ncbi:MAG: ABC transporter substrate-binding protein [Deltaproteobacteria bacterium]|nr:MAG: ABC transporter substrate-binding protein [Deltaproteobacteria bacterium]
MKTEKKKGTMILRGVALVLAIYLGLAVSPALAGPPTDNVKAVINEVMGILNNPAYQAPGQKANRLRLIEESALRRVDYQEMGKRCLGDTWKKLSQSQQTEFIRMFTGLLKTSYADKLDDFGKSKVAYEGESVKGDTAEVRILVLRPNDKIPVRFQLLNSPKGWMIYDLVIEDVSLVDNLRAEFGRVIKASSYAGLVKCLQLKLASNISESKSSPTAPGPLPKNKSKGGS